MASKLVRIIISLLVIFTMSIIPAFGQEEPADADTEASAPVDVNASAFTPGMIYRGVWEGDLESFFEVFTNSDGKVVGEYRWGGPRTKPGSVGITVETPILPDGSITWGDATSARPKFTLSPTNDGLHAERLEKESRSTTEFKKK